MILIQWLKRQLEPEKGKKGALQRFYKRNEFVNNAGRNKDYGLSEFSRTMLYKPK